MKTIKSKIVVAIALGGLMVCGPIAHAQDKPAGTPPAAGDNTAPRPRAGRGQAMQAMMDKLDLTAEQKEKVKPIMADTREKMMALRDDTSLSQEDRQAKMKAINETTDAKLKDILTPDQYTKLQELRKEMRSRGRRPGGPGGPDAAAPATPKTDANQ